MALKILIVSTTGKLLCIDKLLLLLTGYGNPVCFAISIPQQ